MGETLLATGLCFRVPPLLSLAREVIVPETASLRPMQGSKIGRDVMIANQVTLRDTGHCFADLSEPMIKQGFEAREILIEDDVWIGHGAIILKGVHVGHGSMIGAGSVVSKDVPPFAIVAGSPARVLRFRNAHEKGSAEP